MFVHTELVLNARMPLLAGHRVRGLHMMPGLAYIDLLYQLFREHGHEPSELMLRHLSIFAPLAMSADEEVLLDVDWSADGDGVWRITVQGRSRTEGGELTPPTRYATAEMHRMAPVVFDERMDLRVAFGMEGRSASLTDLYAQARAQDLLHDGYMRAEGRAFAGHEYVHVDASLGSQARDSAGESLFHPVLMDGCAVAIAGMLADDDASAAGRGRLFLPLHMESFCASEAIQSGCHARLKRSAFRLSKELSVLTLEFFNEEGRKVAELSNLAGKAVRNSDVPSPGDIHASSRQMAHASGDALLMAVQDHVRAMLATRLKCEPSRIDMDASYYELGLVSVQLMELVSDLSKKVGVSIAPTLLFEYTTVRELAAHLAEQYGACFGVTRAGHETACAAPTASDTKDAQHRLNEPIAIIAMAGRYPGADDMDAFWDLLSQGRDAISEVPQARWNLAAAFHPEKGAAHKSYARHGGFLNGIDLFDPLFFGISPREANVMDPQSRLFLETVWNLLESGGYTRDALKRRHRGAVGVYVGAMYQHYALAEAAVSMRALAALGSFSAIANRVSHFFGFEGPSMAVDTMCSSAATAIHLACQDLRSGECELAVAGGVNLTIDEHKYIGLSQLQIIASGPGSRSFGDGDGYIPAEGVGAVLLKPLSRAVADGDAIQALITGSASLHSGRSNTYMVPSVSAQAKVMRESLRRAGVSPYSVTCVEAAANGSPLGDPVEVAALAKVFGPLLDGHSPCALGSVKSNIGHPEAASCMAQLTKVVLQLRHRQLAPTLLPGGAVNPNLGLEGAALALHTDLKPWLRQVLPAVDDRMPPTEMPRRALINSFAAGGASVSLVVEEYMVPERKPVSAHSGARGAQLIVLSARSRERLVAVIQQLLQHIHQHADIDLVDLAYTLQTGREAMQLRMAVVVSDLTELASRLSQAVSAMEMRAKECEVHDSAIHWADVDEMREHARFEWRMTGLDLDQLAAHWVRGGEVSWEDLHHGRDVQKISLPTYPFARQRHWLDKPDAANGLPEANGGTMETSAVMTRASLDASCRALIAQAMAELLSATPEEFSPYRNFVDYGLDSISGMRLSRRLSTQLGIEVVGRDVLECPNISQLAARLSERLSQLPERAEKEKTIQPDRTGVEASLGLTEALERYQQGRLEIEDLKGFLDRVLAA